MSAPQVIVSSRAILNRFTTGEDILEVKRCLRCDIRLSNLAQRLTCVDRKNCTQRKKLNRKEGRYRGL